ncbi:hypothetical protein [Pelagerythrobacter sp.]|uniref:hypothetical protein n=1 Tax=Pelagerythrobacter sp. TaxID=2800702 RepID=UPI0035B30248
MVEAARKTPWHLWLVGVVSLVWNAFGANDYTQSQLSNRDYLASMTQGMGISVDEMLAYIDSFPAWAHACWAFGTWGAVIGSVLLLLRTRFAVWAFALSLVGLAGTTMYQAVTPQPEWASTGATAIMTVVIWSVATFLLIYAISMRNKGVLR